MALSAAGQAAIQLYEDHLRNVLEPQYSGMSVAIHVGTGQHAIAGSRAAAVGKLRRAVLGAGEIVTLTIGPASVSENQLAELIEITSTKSLSQPSMIGGFLSYHGRFISA